ncbi:MAG: hypothetical protein ACI854_002802 [Arenicella sp.]|jgi:hypothetical protein
MLSAISIAVLQMLTDNSLTGLVNIFVQAETLLNLMGGREMLYLAMVIACILFAARSGRIMSNCLSEMERGKQVKALNLLAVLT